MAPDAATVGTNKLALAIEDGQTPVPNCVAGFCGIRPHRGVHKPGASAIK